MVTATEQFDTATMFDGDYQYFYETFLTDERNRTEVQQIIDLARLAPGDCVLDVGCGYGRIANLLAAWGARVVGFDNSEVLISSARAAAQRSGLHVEYVAGDMRRLPYRKELDVVVSWMAAFGYFDDATNRAVLRQFAHSLRPGGRVIMQTFSRDGALAAWGPYSVVERGDDLCLDRRTFDVNTGRMMYRRTVVRNGTTRHLNYFVRLLTAGEARVWLEDAGFEAISVVGRSGLPLTPKDVWMTVVAQRPFHER